MKKNDTIWQMPSGLKMLPQPQDVYINTGGSGTLHAPTKQQSISSYTPLLDERHLTAFLGHIPESVDDEFIIQLLTVCGELRCWKRARDPYGSPKNFGSVKQAKL
jgi:RNA-binding protein 25